MKLSVIICVYNEAKTVLEILRRVKEVDLGPGWEKEIIIVDNNSTDGTRELLQNGAGNDVRIVFQPRNFGKGYSIRTAIPLCSGDYTIFQDADLEYHPRQYPLIIGKAVKEDLDVVYGSRTLSQKRYHHYTLNYWAVVALTGLTNLLFGSRFTDVATNYKLVRTSLLKSLDLGCSGFDLDFEIGCRLARFTKKIGEIAIDYDPRTYREGKKIGFADGLLAFWAILKCRAVPRYNRDIRAKGYSEP